MKTHFEGRYLDAKTAVPQTAEINVQEAGLSVRLGDGTQFLWPYDQIRQTQGRYSGEPVRLEKGGENPEALTVADADFLISLRSNAPRHSLRFHDPNFRRARVWLTFGAALATIGVALAIYRWGIPSLADRITPFVPVSWENKIGESQLELLAPPGKRLHNERLDSALRRIVARLSGTIKKCPYHFRVTVCDLPVYNAFALPGGSIVVFRDLLRSTRTPEELAGVLAHEMQHVLKRHTTRRIIQDSSTGLLISALSGDATGSMVFALQSARRMALLGYDREEEAEADREGMKMVLAAHINPEGMISFFEKLQKKEKMPEFLKYVSSHPATADRIQALRKIARSNPSAGKALPLLPGVNWAELVGNKGH